MPKAWAFYKKVANSKDGIFTKAEQLEYVIFKQLDNIKGYTPNELVKFHKNPI